MCNVICLTIFGVYALIQFVAVAKYSPAARRLVRQSQTEAPELFDRIIAPINPFRVMFSGSKLMRLATAGLTPFGKDVVDLQMRLRHGLKIQAVGVALF
jgi:hypothetical protein